MKLLLIIALIVPLSTFSEEISKTSANKALKQECTMIVNHGKVGGHFGNKSTGLSYGTYTSLILLAFQEVSLSEDDSAIKNGKPENDKSIYQICKSSLLKASKQKTKYFENSF